MARTTCWWPASNYTRREIGERLAKIPLATSFRSAYAYDNVLYLVAGEIIEAITGQSWEDYISNRLLKRIGMTSSAVRHSAATAGGNVAAPHAFVNGALQTVTPFDSDNTNPAGGIMSNATDIPHWNSKRSRRTSADTRSDSASPTIAAKNSLRTPAVCLVTRRGSRGFRS